MDPNLDRFKESFREESFELLDQMEEYLLELEDDPQNTELLSGLFRAVHTIKGSASMFGFDAIGEFTHTLETYLDQVRNDQVQFNQEILTLCLTSKDFIKDMLHSSEQNREQMDQQGKQILQALSEFFDETVEEEVEVASDDKNQGLLSCYRIRFVPHAEIFLNGTHPLWLIKELTELGDVSIITDFSAIPKLDLLDPELCYTKFSILLTTSADRNEIEDIFIFIQGLSEIHIDVVDKIDTESDEEETKKLGELLVNRKDLDHQELVKALGSQKKIGDVLVENEIVSRDVVDQALLEQQHLKAMRKKHKKVETQSLRVKSEKLDLLVDLVGELVTTQARLSQVSTELKDPQLEQISEQFTRLINELHDNTMNIRMLPIGSAFNKFKRLVRDLSEELKKDILLKTEGGETELDKTMLEKLNDPLIHIIRNCIDHGIEIPEIRKRNGKKEKGTILLTAKHSGGTVQISIEDDGKGLDLENIQKKAIEKGVINQDTVLSDKQIAELIFAPGFSTAEAVTSVSGRGVGMDVVKKQIEVLRGSIDIDSKHGKGTKITLTLPLTLAIIEGLLVQVEETRYVIPLADIEACVEITVEEKELHPERAFIDYRDSILPYLSLREVFDYHESELEIEQIVVINSKRGLMGLLVDKVIGDYQTVIKSLGHAYRDTKGISGATILGDGTIALILDTGMIFSLIRVDG